MSYPEKLISLLAPGRRAAVAVLASLAMLLPGLAAAQSAAEKAVDTPKLAPVASLSELVERYPAGSVQSVEQADQALTETEAIRTKLEAQFAVAQHACYAKFFATACLDGVKEQRRQDIAQVKKIEIEANAFKRAARARDRDQALAERREQAAADLLQREKEQTAKPGSVPAK